MDCGCFCGQLGRFLVFILVAGGCVCSYLAASTCEFFSYETLDGQADQLPEPFLNVTQGTVGVFGYLDENDSCQRYDQIFIDMFDTSFNNYFVTAQFAAVVGPGCAALAWIINLIEWLFYSNQCTYVLVVALLMMGFAIQGLIFMVYGQREFCFDDRVTDGCKLELGAYMAISATSAFYLAAVVWCCMPRSDPFCCVANRNRRKQGPGEEQSQYYGESNTIANMTDPNGEVPGLENPTVYDGASVTADAHPSQQPRWADSENRAPIPQQSSEPPVYQHRYQEPPPTHDMPPAPAEHTHGNTSHGDPTMTWVAHDSNSQTQQDFENPFMAEEESQDENALAQRPAYGNLQG